MVVQNGDIEVREAIRAAILSGQFVPRQRLIEADLCEQFGKSRSSVRVALRDLSIEGLVEFTPNKGARVREVSIEEAIEITEVRKLLEGYLARRAADRVTSSEISSLQAIIEDMHLAVKQSELLRYSDLNAQLHKAIREIGAHKTTGRLLDQIRQQTVRHQFTLSLVPGRPSVSLPQHEAIVAAIASRDPEAAERAMHEHLDSVIEAFRTLALDVVPFPELPRSPS
jgi:DNA-binding GntR family transcriptional regulator